MIREGSTAARDVTRPGLETDAEALHWALSDLVRVYQFRDRDRICCYDISVTQCYALEALAEHGPLRLGALAERLRLDKSTASRVIGALVRKGYAAQGRDARDRRAVAIAITRAGRRLYERITAELIEQQKLVVADIDPKVRAGVVEVVRRLASAAEARFLQGMSAGEKGPACAC